MGCAGAMLLKHAQTGILCLGFYLEGARRWCRNVRPHKSCQVGSFRKLGCRNLQMKVVDLGNLNADCNVCSREIRTWLTIQRVSSSLIPTGFLNPSTKTFQSTPSQEHHLDEGAQLQVNLCCHLLPSQFPQFVLCSYVCLYIAAVDPRYTGPCSCLNPCDPHHESAQCNEQVREQESA